MSGQSTGGAPDCTGPRQLDREAAGWKDLDTHIDDVRALRAIGLAVCGRNELIPSDFADISAVEMEREFDQGVHGVRITGTVSEPCTGAVSSQEVSDWCDQRLFPASQRCQTAPSSVARTRLVRMTG